MKQNKMLLMCFWGLHWGDLWSYGARVVVKEA